MKLKLDKRIPNQNCIFTCFDTECAEQYIGKQGYFTSCYSNFANINKLLKGRLTEIDESLVTEKYYVDTGERKKYYSFFLPPEDYLKPEEKVYRPYTLEEFIKNVGDVGGCVRYKHKDDPEVYHTIITEIRETSGFVVLGDLLICTERLFNEFEYFNGETWVPFGVEK